MASRPSSRGCSDVAESPTHALYSVTAGGREIRTPVGYAYECAGARVTVMELPVEEGWRELSIGVSHPGGPLLERDVRRAMETFGRGIPTSEWLGEPSEKISNMLIISTMLAPVV